MAAVRAIAQSGLHPANCRLLDPGEAALSGASPRRLVRAGAGRRVGRPPGGRPSSAELVDLARDHGGTVDPAARRRRHGPRRDAASEAWRSAFLRMPYVRDGLARMSAIVETFETAMHVGPGRRPVRRRHAAEVGAAIEQVTGAPGMVNCRFTHVYPDGAAPYFTVVAAGRPGDRGGACGTT